MYFAVTIPSGVGREMVKWEMWGPEMPGGHPRWTSLITCSSSIVESPPFISSSSSDDIGGYGDCAEEPEAEDSVLSSIEEDHEENNQTLRIIKSPIFKTLRFYQYLRLFGFLSVVLCYYVYYYGYERTAKPF